MALKKPALKELRNPLLKAAGIISLALLSKYVFDPAGGLWAFFFRAILKGLKRSLICDSGD